MNKITLSGYIKDIEESHKIEDISFSKARIITKRENGLEDAISIKFKSLSNKYKENDLISITGNIRSYSHKVNEKNKVDIYVFTYFDVPEQPLENEGVIDGRICKMNTLRTTRNGRHNVHFILANNIYCQDNKSRLNSYIPCIAWGKLAKEICKLSQSTKVKLKGQLHSREHRKVLENGEIELRVAHEFLVTEYKVIQ
jgi:hypothetical protein